MKLLSIVIGLLIYVGSVSSQGTDPSLKTSKEFFKNLPTMTGSGQIFGGPVVRYSTLDYLREVDRPIKQRANKRKNVERHLHGKRRHHLQQKNRILELRFHNYTSLDKSAFESEINIQIEALNRDFTVSEKIHRNVIGLDPTVSRKLQLLEFRDKGGNHNPRKIVWEAWDSFDKRGNSPNIIDVHVVEQLPDKIGHGYARFIWSSDPNAADIVIRRASFGSGSGDFDQGKVLTHLMANHLGLLPLAGTTRCQDDGLLETPIHNTPLNFCSNEYRPISLCDNQYMLMDNFMSHTPDACKTCFTPGQWKRMLNVLDLQTEPN